MIMKQIQECLDRAFSSKEPLPSKKWKGFLRFDEKAGWVLIVYHYHHHVLTYLVDHNQYAFEWWERPADKRGLDSCKEYLEERWRKHHNIKV